MTVPVSVQIVTYNEEKNIAACLIQILRNNPEEVVVIDRGSEDLTVEIARLFGVRVLQFPNTGRGYRRLQGIRSTTSRYVAFVDADDRIPADWLAEMLSELVEGSYSALQSSLRVSRKDHLLCRGWNAYFEESIKPSKDSIMVGRPALYLRSSILDLGSEISHFAEDTEFSKYLYDREFRQGISHLISYREVPLFWKVNFKKWRGYGRGYSDFLQKHPNRRLAIWYHILIKIPFVRGINSALRGHPFAIAFNLTMAINIFIGLIKSDLRLLGRSRRGSTT